MRRIVSMISVFRLETDLKHSKETGKANTAFALMINGVSVSDGDRETHMMWRSRIIIERRKWTKKSYRTYIQE